MGIPVLAIDGPSGSGKGAVGRAAAAALGWHYLDSGAVYRALALAATEAGLSPDDCHGLARLASTLPVRFETSGERIWLGQADVTDALRSEACGTLASRVAALPAVREALLAGQRAHRRPPGLVADGRDMGSVVFPDADVKVFLTASAEVRAGRRLKQLNDKGLGVTLSAVLADIRTRDARDEQRPVAPLRPASGAITIDNSGVALEVTVAQVLGLLENRLR